MQVGQNVARSLGDLGLDFRPVVSYRYRMPIPLESPVSRSVALRFRVWLATLLVRSFGYCVVRETPLSLLPSRVAAIARRVRTSGHLGHRYHVRRNLEQDIAAVTEQVERLRVASDA
jgi:hypothetical protein